MEISVVRNNLIPEIKSSGSIVKQHGATAGVVLVDGKYFSLSLEDTERYIASTDNVKAIEIIKVKGETAIPYGRYKVVLSMSTRFKKILPEVLNVPGFAGIRIHAGNTIGDTEGCILLGSYMQNSGNSLFLASSKVRVDELIKLIEDCEKRKEDVYLTVELASYVDNKAAKKLT